MTTARLPEHEHLRLAALRRYQVLDTLPEQVYEDVVLLAAQICGAPIALISFVDATRQWFKAKIGLDVEETSRDTSFCAHTILDTVPLVVVDALRDQRFLDNPLAVGSPGLRAYAAAPIVTGDGYPLGSVCVYDRVPRQFAPEQVAALEALSRQVVSHLELRQQVQMEEELVASLLESRERHELAVRASRDGVWGCDRVRRTTYCSPRGRAILGIDEGPIPASLFDWFDRVHPEDVRDVACAIETGLHEQQSYDVEFRWRWHDGSYRWLHVRASAIQLSDGTNVRIAGSVADVTDRRTAAEDLQRAKEAAEAANRAKSTFLATMTHEIRTPMNGVLGFTELLYETPLDDQQREYLGVIERSGKSLLRIIDDVLDYAKIEAGRMDLELIPFAPRDAVADVVRLLQPKAKEKGLTLEAEIADDVPAQLLGDPNRLGQVLLNLAGNAVKFTGSGGVRVSLQLLGEDRLRIEVADTGIGITDDQRPLLFRDFSQADSSTSRRYGGTGLGLVISRRLVELMGGRIGVDSESGQGSTFWIELPLRLPASPERAPAAGGATGGGGARRTTPRFRVLLAEDNPVNQHLASRFLGSLDCEVEVAANGREAVERAARGDFALILMDCLMPEMDGYTAAREIRLREKAAGRHVPIVAVTANAMASDRQACFEAGMDDYLSKPFRKDDLRRVLDRWGGRTS